jgi:UDP-galactopyranose mutase
VCLLPFALNEATRFISPTKTLEYLAAGRPAVSTPVRDVAECYAGIVDIAADAAEFVAACEDVLAWSEADRARFAEAAKDVVARTSWDHTAQNMHQLLTRFERPALNLPAMAAAAATELATDMATRALPHRGARRRPDRLVGGAGARRRGLAARAPGHRGRLVPLHRGPGLHLRLRRPHHVLERPLRARSLQRLLGDNLHWQDREAWVYSKSVYTRYPFQGALYGLPPEVLKECLIGAIEARFGPLKKPELRVAGNDEAVAAAPAVAQAGAPRNFEEFIHRVWGAGVAKHFAIPYNKKLWAVPLDEMETSWLGGRVPLPNLEEMIEGALQPVPKPMGPNARFGYPLRGGFQALMDGFLPLLEAELQLGADVVAVSPAARMVTLADGRRFSYDSLISTLPLPRLVAAMGDEAPPAVREAAAALRHVSVRCVNLGIAREAITDKHWIYYPEDTVFHRIFVQGNASPHNNAPGGFGLTCEISYSPNTSPCRPTAMP